MKEHLEVDECCFEKLLRCTAVPHHASPKQHIQHVACNCCRPDLDSYLSLDPKCLLSVSDHCAEIARRLDTRQAQTPRIEQT